MSEATIYNWERHETRPPNWHVPRIIRFLGYNPIVPGRSLGESLKAGRRLLGLSRKQVAALTGLNESTLAKLEQGKSRRPSDQTLSKLAGLIGYESSILPVHPDQGSPRK